ncbi:hypothetical protein B0H19DRAFT_1370271 [Mycena capillaripes]|nr:hypothetical protein B0H19DRAFT_1370271 [Mycena capillaripes]
MVRTKEPKSKEMFKPYNPADVPDIMPFPEVALVFATKSEDTARGSGFGNAGGDPVAEFVYRDLPSLKGKAATEFYDQVKTDAFDAKAFKHTPQPQDAAEEACLPALVAAWKRQHLKKNKNDTPAAEADDGNTSDDEQDGGARRALLRGYTKAGWRSAIQKVISNKRTAENNKRRVKGSKKDDAEESNSEPSAPSAMVKLLNLATYTGRDKFREDRHDEIHEYSKTLPGAINAGGKFRKAESLLWAKEDQASWEAAASSEEGVDWEARRKLVARGFKNMVNTLHTSGKFRPFVATMLMVWLGEDGKMYMDWTEAIPDGIHVCEPFQKKYAKLVGEQIDNMYEWAEKPLKDYAATREDSVKCAAPPLFPLSAEALDDISPKTLAQTVTSFLEQSYQAAFGSQEIPWTAIVSAPDEYYDTAQSPLTFAATGLAKLTRPEWYELANTLVSVAGAGTSGFFRKALLVPPPPPPPPPPPRSPPTPPPLEGDKTQDPPKKPGRKRKADAQLGPEDDAPQVSETRRTARPRKLPEEAAKELQQKAAAAASAPKAKPSYECVVASPVKIKAKKELELDLKFVWN